MVFPFFLWIAGMAMTLSFASRVERGADRAELLRHALRRSALIFAVGLLLNGFPAFNLATIRIPGVLQRIAICYLAGAAIYLYTSTRSRILWLAMLLGGYWIVMALGGDWENGSTFAQRVDSMLLSGHMYSQTKTWDPEGVVSTLPAIATILFGILTGELLRTRLNAAEKTVRMFLLGNALIAAGLMLDPWIPINKQLWTSSYSLFMAGMASVTFAFFYWFVDLQGWRGWTRPLVIYGSNAIVVYALSGMVARLAGLIKIGDVSLKAILMQNAFSPLTSPINASLLYAICNVLLLYSVAWVMHRRGWFVRL